MWLVDSSVWIDYFNGTETLQTQLLDANLGRRPIAVGDIILTEVLQGFRQERDFLAARHALLCFPVLPLCGIEIAVRAAEHYRLLRRRGVTVRKTIDCLIATFAIEKGHSLLHRDRDFDPFEQYLGLHVVKPGIS